MANITDYVCWRGDIGFDERPFNDLDNLIFAELVYLNFTGIVPSDKSTVPLSQALKDYFAKYGENGGYIGAIIPEAINDLAKKIKDKNRYKDLLVSRYVDVDHPGEAEQFAAITFTKPKTKEGPEWHVIAFSGTDDTVHGWKENLLLALEEGVLAQEEARKYLQKTAHEIKGPLYLVGHSKGGNLAVYAATKAEKDVQDRIVGVYNNDGPGFFKAFLKEEDYKRIRDRIITILPIESRIGTMLTQERSHRIQYVDCNVKGIYAHNGFTWQALGTSFIQKEGLTKESAAFDIAMNEALAACTMDERRMMVQKVFTVLEETGAYTLTDFEHMPPRKILRMLKEFREDPLLFNLIWMVITGTVRETIQLPWFSDKRF